MSDQWGVPQQQPSYAPPPQPHPQAQPQPVYGDPSNLQPQRQPQHSQQQHSPQPQPQYVQPGSIPQQGQYSQAEGYTQPQQPMQSAASPSQPLPPPIPHPDPLSQVEAYPGVPGQGPGSGAGSGFGVGPHGSGGSGGSGDLGGGGGAGGRAGKGSDGGSGSGNSFATAGAITSFVPVIGLLLSLVGLFQSRGRRAGKTVARIGVVLSLVFSAAWGVAGYYGYRSAYAKVSDPGCVSADADFLGYSTQMQDDATAMADAAGSPGGARSAGFTTAVRNYQADLAKLVADFDVDSVKADGSSLKTAIQTVSTDLTGLDTDFGYLATGDFAAATNLMDLNGKLITDFQSMESVCKQS